MKKYNKCVANLNNMKMWGILFQITEICQFVTENTSQLKLFFQSSFFAKQEYVRNYEGKAINIIRMIVRLPFTSVSFKIIMICISLD